VRYGRATKFIAFHAGMPKTLATDDRNHDRNHDRNRGATMAQHIKLPATANCVIRRILTKKSKI
jgi:hypothetical protein